MPVFFCTTARQEKSGPIDLLGQLLENRSEPLRSSQAEVRRRKFSLLQEPHFVAIAFDQCPCGFGATTFHAEDSFGWIHDWLTLAVFAPVGSVGPTGPVKSDQMGALAP